MIEGAGILQKVPWEMVNLLRPFFTPGLRPLPNCDVRLTGSAASITLPTTGSLPGNFRALLLLAHFRTDRAATTDYANARFNADAGNNYNKTQWTFGGAGAHAPTTSRAATSIAGLLLSEGANSQANNFAVGMALFPGYAMTDREKQCLAFSGHVGDLSADAQMEIRLALGQWQIAPIAAITSMTFLPNTGPNFVAGTWVTLYGVL